MSKSLYIKLLEKGPILLFGTAFLGSTASFPTAYNTLNPGCFDFSEQLKSREKQLREYSKSPQTSSFSGRFHPKSLNSRIGGAVSAAAMNNPCYEAITSYGGFWNWTGWQDSGKTTLTRANKGNAFSSLMGCDNESFKLLWPIMKEWWKDTEFWKKGEGKVSTYSKNNSNMPDNWSKFFDWFWESWEEMDRNDQGKSISKMEENSNQGDGWGKAWSIPRVFERVAVKVELHKDDGEWQVYSSSCASATIKRKIKEII